MLGPVVKFLQDVGSLWKFRDQLLVLCQDHPFPAGILIFIGLTVLAYLVITNLVEVVRKVAGWLHSTVGIIGVIVGIAIIGSISAGVVLSLRAALAPVPLLIVDRDTFLSQPILLKWKYDRPAASRDEAILYEVQSAADGLFSSDQRSETSRADGTYKWIDHVNATRFWRVRAIDGQTHRALSDWSRALPLTQYDSVYRRIEATRKFVVYVSDSTNQDVFKWVADDFAGLDIELARIIGEQLAVRMGKTSPFKPDIVPVPWEQLLDMPSRGRADLIISSITKRDKRERDHKIKFSDAYFCTSQSLIYREGRFDRPIRELIVGKRIGYQRKTTSADLVDALNKEQPFEPKPYDQVEDMVQALRQSEIDFGVTDTPFAASARLTTRFNNEFQLGYKEFKKADFPASVPENQRIDEYAIAVHGDDAQLLEAVNAILAKIKQDGSLTNLFQSETQKYENAKNIPQGARGGEFRAHPWEC